jgi:hypothetical protein
MLSWGFGFPFIWFLVAGDSLLQVELSEARSESQRVIAEALEVSPRSVDLHWAYARAWLKEKLKQ